MNFRVDIMIIGDSTAGHSILDKLAVSNSDIKLAFISQAFKSTTTHDYVNVKYFKKEVVYVSYRHRLFCCYLKNGDQIYSTHLVIASGLKYEPLMLNNEVIPCVFNNSDDLLKNAKNQPVLVIYNHDTDAKLAVEVAKKYKQVYLCTKEIALTDKVAKKLAKVDNIAVIPNASVSKVILENETLQKIELDNYSTINCSAIYVKTTATPAIDFIPKKIIPRNTLGYLDVSDKCESNLVPKCFAIGSCIPKYTKTMEQQVIKGILSDF